MIVAIKTFTFSSPDVKSNDGTWAASTDTSVAGVNGFPVSNVIDNYRHPTDWSSSWGSMKSTNPWLRVFLLRIFFKECSILVTFLTKVDFGYNTYTVDGLEIDLPMADTLDNQLARWNNVEVRYII